MSAAVASTLPKATGYATLDLTVNFVRPIPADSRNLQVRAEVGHKGRTFAVANAQVLNGDDKTVATATGSWIVLPGRPVPGRRDFVDEYPGAGQ
jgi:uncharacterized protein (TIGR00369 family)